MNPNDRHIPPQQKPTLWEETLLLGAGPTGERSGPPPRLAVEGRSSGHGPMLPISDVDKVKPMLLPHGGWPMAAGPASRLGSIEPGDKTGLRLSPHLAPSTFDVPEYGQLLPQDLTRHSVDPPTGEYNPSLY